MNYETIEQTIELLCEKFGIVIDSVASLIPTVAQYNIWVDVVGIIVGIIGLTIIGVIAYKGFTDDWDEEILVGIVAVGTLVAAVCLAIIIANTIDALKWGIIPELAFVEYIANYIA